MWSDRTATNSACAAGRKLQGDFAAFCDKAAEAFAAFDFLGGPVRELRDLRKSVIHPFNIAVFGRMKTGKSTLINALVGRRLAVTGVEEATATVNVLTHSDHPGSFVAHWKDSPPETFPIEAVQTQWNGKTDDVLERVRRVSYLELFSDADSLKLCEITDTPGTGSEESTHEDVVQNFLAATEKHGRRADAIVYVFPPVGRESDIGNLETYRRNNCLPDSDPYNSVAVLHKWDHIFWENGGDMSDIRGKAARLKGIMSSAVADVIPVSAPLALAATEAPDAFWAQILDLCRSTAWPTLEEWLGRDGKWDRDDARRRVRRAYPLPWPSFQVIVREIARNLDMCGDVSAARTRVRLLSGIETFKDFLDANFFKRSELIRQKQVYAEILRVKEKAYALIERRVGDLKKDRKAWDALFGDGHYDADPFMAAWISQKRSACREEAGSLRKSYDDVDRMFINSEIRERIEDADNLAWAENAQTQGRLGLTADDVSTLRRVCAYLAVGGAANRPDGESLETLYEKMAGLSNRIQSSVRDNASRIMRRVSLVLDEAD